MKKNIISILVLFFSISLFSQTNEEIAGVYIRKAEKNFSELQIDEAAKNFGKAIKLLDTINNHNVAWLGARIKYELKEYTEAKKYSKYYFQLAKNKKSQDYTDMLDLYVMIEEELEKIEAQRVKEEKARLAREKEERRIDSLKTEWKNKANALTLKVDAIQNFNNYNISTFKKGAYVGIVDHMGAVLVKADTYKSAKNFDGFIVLMNDVKEPTKVFYYDSKTKNSGLLPSVSDFNTLSTHYGNVMLPRGNGTIVTYPNNSLKAFVYNVNSKQFITIADQKSLFKELRKTDKIEKSNKEGQVRIAKQWYHFGGHIGGEVYALYQSDYKLFGFLCGLDGTVLQTTNYQGIGAFYNGKFHVINEDSSYWINQNGTKVSVPEDEGGSYTGNSKVVKVESGGFRIHQIIDGAEYIILGNERLELLEDFLRKHP
jgi:glutaredoxin-related protein